MLPGTAWSLEDHRFGTPRRRSVAISTFNAFWWTSPNEDLWYENSTRQPPPQNSNRHALPHNQARPANFVNKGKNVVNYSRPKQDIDCFRCKGKGHYASKCPGSKNLHYAHNEDDAYDSEPVDEEIEAAQGRKKIANGLNSNPEGLG